MTDTCKPRSRRYPVSKPAVMRAADGHRLVSVINASRRGLGLRGRNLPMRGEYVEIRLQDGVLVGRVAWSTGARCGIQTQDTVQLGLLTAPPNSAGGAGVTAGARRGGQPQMLLFEASRSYGRMIQFGAIGVLIFAAGMCTAGLVQGTLTTPLRTVEATLAQVKQP